MTRTTAGWAVLAVAIGNSAASGQATAPRTKAAPGPIVAAGAMFAEPRGWTRVKTPEKSKTIGRFIDPGSDSAQPRRMILIDFGRPTEDDARASAQGLAKDWGGAVVAEATTLDGAPAYRVRAESRGPGLKPVEGVVAHHAGRLYLIMGGAVPGQAVAGEVEEVRRGWKWARAR